MPGRRGGVSREQRTDGRRSENRPIVGMATNRLKEGLPARRILTARTDCNVYVIDTHTGAVRRIAVGLGFHGLVSVPEDQPRIHGQPPLTVCYLFRTGGEVTVLCRFTFPSWPRPAWQSRRG